MRMHTLLFAAAAIALVLLFFTGPLQYVPIAALGAVLVRAAFSLLDLNALKLFYQLDRHELSFSLIATLGVAAVGAVQAILVVVVLALLRFVHLVSRPKVEVLGKVPGLPGLHSIDRHSAATTTPGLLIFRFNAPVVFFNAPYFKRSVLERVNAAGGILGRARQRILLHEITKEGVVESLDVLSGDPVLAAAATDAHHLDDGVGSHFFDQFEVRHVRCPRWCRHSIRVPDAGFI